VHRGVAALRELLVTSAGTPAAPRSLVLAVSGGADSLALAVLAAVLRGTRDGEGLRIGAVVVDHGLQEGSADVAQAAARVCTGLGLDPVTVQTVRVQARGEGLEAAARDARMTALAAAARRAGAGLVATAHTADDQAEQVLLALARGSGTRSLAGMPARRPLAQDGVGSAADIMPDAQRDTAEAQAPREPLVRGERHGPTCAAEPHVDLVRPLLALTRADTEAVCAWAGVTWWADPMNTDPDVRRVRIRETVLPLIEDEHRGLGPGVRAGLVRSAAIAAEDAAALESWAARELTALTLDEAGPDRTDNADVPDALGAPGAPCAFDAPDVPGGLDASDAAAAAGASRRRIALDLDGLAVLPAAVRHRIYARAAALTGADPTTRERLLAVDALVTQAHRGGSSAGPVQLGGGTQVRRRRRDAAGGGTDAGAGAHTCARLEFHPDPAVD